MSNRINLERYRLFAHSELWDSQGVLNMNRMREPVKEAYAEVVAKTLGKYVGQRDKILEVGCALGWLTELVPQYKAQITQTEGSAELVDHAKRSHRELNIQNQNIYDLTFNSGSFDTVVALGAYDVLRDLSKACSETRRVLSKGGKFIHFLDQHPDSNPLIEAYQQQGYYAFPGLDAGSTIGFYLISIGEFEQVHQVLKEDIPWLADIMEDYIKDPAMMYQLFMSTDPIAVSRMAEVLNHLSDDTVIIKTPSQIDLFQSNLVKVLGDNRFRIIEVTSPSAEVVVPRRDIGSQFAKFDVIRMINGTLTAFNLDLPNNQRKIQANMNVVIAEAI